MAPLIWIYLEDYSDIAKGITKQARLNHSCKKL